MQKENIFQHENAHNTVCYLELVHDFWKKTMLLSFSNVFLFWV